MGATATTRPTDVRRFWSRHVAGQAGKHAYLILLGLKAMDSAGLLRRIEAGLPYRSWEAFLRNSELGRAELIDLVRIPPRTLTRRKERGRLEPDESDRLARAARVFGGAILLFEGDAQGARRWFTSPQIALGGARPIDYAASDVGAREVEALIGRLEHGIPA